MSGIVCAIRGGASSQSAINQAINTAIAAKLPISFLYVLNLDFLKKGSQSRTQTISEEMRKWESLSCWLPGIRRPGRG